MAEGGEGGNEPRRSDRALREHPNEKKGRNPLDAHSGRFAEIVFRSDGWSAGRRGGNLLRIGTERELGVQIKESYPLEFRHESHLVAD